MGNWSRCFCVQTMAWVVVSDIFYFHPYLGKIPNLTNSFQMGWNHQLVALWVYCMLNLQGCVKHSCRTLVGLWCFCRDVVVVSGRVATDHPSEFIFVAGVPIQWKLPRRHCARKSFVPQNVTAVKVPQVRSLPVTGASTIWKQKTSQSRTWSWEHGIWWKRNRLGSLFSPPER